MALPNDDSLAYQREPAPNPATRLILARIIGMSRDEILQGILRNRLAISRDGDGWSYAFDAEALKGNKLDPRPD